MTENSSNTADSTRSDATADTANGRWVVDPENPEYEVWEEAAVDDGEVDDEAVDDEEDPAPKTAPIKQRQWSPEKLANRCTAHKKNGERCRRAAIAGGSVCRVHGGAAPAVKAAARARLEMAADRMAANLLRIAVDDDAPDSVKLSATNSALDRAGLSAKTAMEVQVGPTKPFQDILEAVMTGGSRAESRARRGVADTAPDNDWLDAEVVDLTDDDDAQATTPRPSPRHDDPQPIAGELPTSKTGMVDLADALDQLHGQAPRPVQRRKGRR